MSDIGERLAKWRLSEGIKLREIKEKANISTGNFSDLERGKALPSAKTLISLKTEYDLSSDWILFDEDKEIRISENRYIEINKLFDDLSDKELIKMEGYIEDAKDKILERRITSLTSDNTG